MSSFLPQFQASYTATAATVAIGPVSKGILVHTVVFPKASVGTVSLTDTAGNVYVAFPAGSIGSVLLDMVCNSGLKIVQGSASDQVTVTYQSL